MFRSLISVFAVIALALSAQAKSIKGLPSQLKDQIPYFEMQILESVTGLYNCRVDVTDGDFFLESTEKQDSQYAEYPGELSSFVVKVKTDLGGKACDDKYGALTCHYKFDLYDEQAYQLNKAESECE